MAEIFTTQIYHRLDGSSEIYVVEDGQRNEVPIAAFAEGPGRVAMLAAAADALKARGWKRLPAEREVARG